MQKSSFTKLLLTGVMALCFALSSAVYGQGLTSSAMNGYVTDKQGKAIAGASITVVHEPSGTRATTTTRENGQFNVSGLRPGGPYTVTVSAANEQAETRKDVELDLSSSSTVNFSLGSEVVQLEKFTVSEGRDTTFGTGKMGTGTTLSDKEISNVPTVRRDIQDLAVLDSRMALMSLDQGGNLSAQGQNFRFNSLLIDGVRADDQFGLNGNGFSSLRSPIPPEALQTLSIELSPYDVRYAGATGAFINVVTKSGSNTFHGGAAYETTDQGWRGPNLITGAREVFKERTYNFGLGGPIIKDKLFFYFNYDDFERIAAPPQNNFVPDATQLASIIARASALGYDAGGLSANNVSYQKTTIGKIDWNVSEGQRLSLTYRKNEGQNIVFANYTNSTQTSLSNYWYVQPRLTDSYVAQLNSQWTPNLRTEFTYSYTTYDGSPHSNGKAFPQVLISGVTGLRLDNNATISTGGIFIGTESSRQLNAITTKETQLKFSADYSMGDHTVTAGVEDIATKYTNAFIQYTDGYYTFATPATWQAGTPPSAYTLAKPYPGSTIADGIARWSYDAYSAFVQDKWQPNRRLTLLAGLRLDYPHIGSKPPVAPGFATAGFTSESGKAVTRNDTTNDGNSTFAPRIGFSYEFPSERKTQLRGGIGLFQGKNPAVWLSNAYSNAGSVYTYNAVSGDLPAITFNANPDTQTVPGTGTAAPNINITDPKLKQPALWKSNLAIDHKLPFLDMTVSAEVYYDVVQYGLNTEYLNYLVATSGPTTMPDGRIRYAGAITPAANFAVAGVTAFAQFPGTTAYNSSTGVLTFPSTNLTGRRRVTTGGTAGTGFADVLYLTNANAGESKGGTISFSRPLKDGWAYSLSWTHGHATEVSPVTSSTASSNYSNRASFNPNEAKASTSNTDIKDRIVAMLTHKVEFVKGYPTTVQGIFQVRTGHPYSWVFRGDANGDGYTFNDLLYVPTGPSDPKVAWASTTERDAFFTLVNNTSLKKYMGSNAPRNGETSPWTNGLDVKITQAIPLFNFEHAKAEVYMNLLNLGNLLNPKWGRYEEIPFSYRRAVAGATYSPTGNGGLGQWNYTYNANTIDAVPLVVNDFQVSRWQVQMGMRITF